MADPLDSLQQMVRDAQSAKAWLEQATALKNSTADLVAFTCANPPYADLFCLKLSRELWGSALDAAMADAQSKIDAVAGVTSAVKIA